MNMISTANILLPLDSGDVPRQISVKAVHQTHTVLAAGSGKRIGEREGGGALVVGTNNR